MGRVFAVPLGERLGRCGVILATDAAIAAAAFRAAMSLRFDGQIPPPHADRLWRGAAVVVAARLAAIVVARVHRWPFLRAGLPEAVRLAAACVTGSALALAFMPLVARPGPPPTVYALELFLASAALALLRFGPRVALGCWCELGRDRVAGAPVLVVGTSFAAESLAREVRLAPGGGWTVIGFVGTDPAEVGRRIDGTPVVGVARDLAALVERTEARVVLLAIPRTAAARLRKAIVACARAGVRFRIVPPAASLADPISPAMLDEVAPEDLVEREQVELDRSELRRLVSGASALVTGAGGAIGAEACRQLAHLGVRKLVMVDRDRERLYRRARRIAAERPELDLHAEVADPAEAGVVERLGARHRPRYVFHAAAAPSLPLSPTLTVPDAAGLLLAEGLGVPFAYAGPREGEPGRRSGARATWPAFTLAPA
jgi:FlaA1/EpsC-like NDP-sugar epimerase